MMTGISCLIGIIKPNKMLESDILPTHFFGLEKRNPKKHAVKTQLSKALYVKIDNWLFNNRNLQGTYI